jgi:DNA-directed RNA polymerase subunit RPC12/RpoP
MLELCETCSTPLDEERRCVTCDAEAEGLKLLIRSGYASVREMMTLLEEQKLAPEMEQVPPRRPEEKAHPLWNLYVPRGEAEQAVAFLRKDWSELLDDPEAAAAAQRGQDGIDLDAGGEVDCPACGHRFTIQAGSGAECPECGLSLGAPAEAAPDESQA